MNWQPSDNFVVQMLVNRGIIPQEQLAFASAAYPCSGERSLLALMLKKRLVSQADVEAMVALAREDERLRGVVQIHGLLPARLLSEAARRQRGTRRTLLEVLEAERLCDAATLQQLRLALAGEAPRRVVGFPQRPLVRREHA
jgi:hypothetical protein